MFQFCFFRFFGDTEITEIQTYVTTTVTGIYVPNMYDASACSVTTHYCNY